jgi:hypothetical protein
MSDDLDIASRAEEPKSASVDGQSVEGHSLPDLIEADRHVQNKAFGRKTAAIRLSNLFTVLKPPGGI